MMIYTVKIFDDLFETLQLQTNAFYSENEQRPGRCALRFVSLILIVFMGKANTSHKTMSIDLLESRVPTNLKYKKK